MMLNDSVHRRMVLNTTTGHTTDYTGCIVCHTEVTFIFNSSTGPIDMQITDHSGAHTWNSKPDCTKCHSINTNIERPGPYPGGHESFNMEWENNTQCLGCHVGKQSHGHSVSGGGDPDCISCHDIDSSALSRVNVSFINSSAHMNLNIDAIDTSGTLIIRYAGDVINLRVQHLLKVFTIIQIRTSVWTVIPISYHHPI